jgi:hypothetical protein
VHKYMRAHRSEGATEPGQDGPGPTGLAHPGVGSAPLFLEREDPSTLSTWRRRHLQGESHLLERPSTS